MAVIYSFNLTEKICADLGEVYRCCGLKNSLPDEELTPVVLEIKEEIENAASFKLCYRKNILSEASLDFGLGEVNSKNLAKNIKDCSHVYIFAATLGIEVDRIISRYSALSPSKAVIAQGCAAALIESFCNYFCISIAAEEKKKGRFLRPRFSPGYGDFDIKYQIEILKVLDASKRTGITLTDSLLMLPSKSVTAVIGVSQTNSDCSFDGCEMCSKTNCLYKRG